VRHQAGNATAVMTDSPDVGAPPAERMSHIVAGVRGSAILQIASEVRTLVAEGRTICNLTVGDFNPASFPIPEGLSARIVRALDAGETNYPPSNGMPALREAVRRCYRDWLGLDVPLEGIVVTGGSRPGIYATYGGLVDPGDRVLYPVPSWNNDAYVQLAGAEGVAVRCDAATNFLPTRAMLAPLVRGARLLALNSPLNPTGTAFDAETLGDICDLVLAENARRGPAERPLYVMYDQVYWMLTFGEVRHVTPTGLRPAMAPYTVYVDGISKAFAATGLRVGWIVAPADLGARFSDFLGHVGAWAPRAEQVATAALLQARDEVDAYHATMQREVQARLDRLYSALRAWHAEGLPVDAIPPMGAIYLSARFALAGGRTAGGDGLTTNEDIRRYLLDAAGVAVVPFQAFADPEQSGWFRLSVGAVTLAEIDAALPRIRAAIEAAAR
jgi:aspartate aminotransferase